MEKININFIADFFHYIYIFTFICSPISLLAVNNYESNFSELDVDSERFINYEKLEEYEEMYRIFEAEMEEEGSEEYSMKGGSFSKWGNPLKRWLKQTTVSLIKKMVNLKKIRNSEDCAYTVVEFKRKLDALHETGDIETMLNSFGVHVPDDPRYASMEKFKNRIRYYHYNEKAKPAKCPFSDRYCIEFSQRYRNNKNDLDDIPARALIGGVEIACGSLIMVLPFPGCRWLGWTLITHGTTQIYEGYMNEYEEQSTKNESTVKG